MDMQKQTSTSSLAKIDGVHSNITQLNPSTSGMWLNFFQSINPLGTIADMYAKTLAYRIEVKRLEAEQERIKQQAMIAHNVIDKTFQLKMEELTQRKMALVGFYETLNRELERIHIERKTVLDMAQMANTACLQPNISIEERLFYKDLSLSMTKELHTFGERGSIQLQAVIQALPKVDITNRLIEG